jgi:hypothetical protein
LAALSVGVARARLFFGLDRQVNTCLLFWQPRDD